MYNPAGASGCNRTYPLSVIFKGLNLKYIYVVRVGDAFVLSHIAIVALALVICAFFFGIAILLTEGDVASCWFRANFIIILQNETENINMRLILGAKYLRLDVSFFDGLKLPVYSRNGVACNFAFYSLIFVLV